MTVGWGGSQAGGSEAVWRCCGVCGGGGPQGGDGMRVEETRPGGGRGAALRHGEQSGTELAAGGERQERQGGREGEEGKLESARRSVFAGRSRRGVSSPGGGVWRANATRAGHPQRPETSRGQRETQAWGLPKSAVCRQELPQPSSQRNLLAPLGTDLAGGAPREGTKARGDKIS